MKRAPRWLGIMGVVGMIVTGGGPAPAHAHWHIFGRTDDTMTARGGRALFELAADYDNRRGVSQNQVGADYGITDHWMISLHGVSTSGGGRPFEVSRLNVATRARLGERNQFIVDPGVSLEYQLPFQDRGLSALEAKVILGKQVGFWTMAANVIYESEDAISSRTNLFYNF